MSEAAAHTFSPVVLAPTFNNDRTLGAILDRLDAAGLPVIVVNDGCTDSSPGVLERWRSRGGARTVLTHARNLGKAAALRTGFEAAAAMGRTHAVTIDTDGQHDPEDVSRLVDVARVHPEALVLGVRSASIAGYPSRSMTGRRISNLFIRIESGANVTDSQSGFRVYPLGLVRSVRTFAGRFGFETEILTRATWAGCAVVEIPITSRYFPPGERVSHFRPFVDSVRAVGMHVRLIGRAIWPMPHRQWPGPHAHDPRPWWKRLWAWLSPLRLWKQLHQDPESRPTAAAGFALGVFLANTPPPLYGLHLPLGLFLARRLNFHPLPVAAGCALAAPPLGLILIMAGVALGSRILKGHWPHLNEMHPTQGHFWEWAWGVLPEWWLGAAIVGLALAVLGFLLVKLLLSGMAVTPPDPAVADQPASGSAPDGAVRPESPE